VGVKLGIRGECSESVELELHVTEAAGLGFDDDFFLEGLRFRAGLSDLSCRCDSDEKGKYEFIHFG
jgi:hypothetical protein